LGLLSRVASYCVSHSTPLGLGWFFSQVPPGAIISRSELLRFRFNPFEVVVVVINCLSFWFYQRFNIFSKLFLPKPLIRSMSSSRD